MQSVISRILNDNFNKGDHSLDFSHPVLELSCARNEIIEGTFHIYGPKNEPAEGYVSSNRLRMKCPVTEFSGSDSEIPYIFDSTGMDEGDSQKGEFRVISNHGEYLIPYSVTVRTSNVDTSLGDIKNLFHFTNLARSNYDEACDLFYSDDFETILNGADRLYLSVYRALKDSPDKEQALEEFLLRIKKKQSPEFMVDEPNIRIDTVLGSLERKVMITKNGWGYSHLKVSATDDFILPEKDLIEDPDYMGNCAFVNYRIVEENLHEGKNYGQIILSNAYNDIHINICVIKHPMNRMVKDISRSEKHSLISLMQYYEAFRCRKISSKTWMEESGKIVEALKDIDKDNAFYELMHVQLLITQERFNEARWSLEMFEDLANNTEDDTLYCYYNYLLTLVERSDENTARVAHEVEQLFERDKSNWKVGWLLLYLSEDYARYPEKRWAFLKELYRLGTTSPVIYVEAFALLLNNPTLLTELSSFELSVLRYMARKEILTPDIIEQFLTLFDRSRIYKQSFIPLFKECYKTLPNNDVLKSFCTLMINLGITDQEAFKWYEKAINEGLKITKLYEYYMMSLDMEAIIEIPKIVLMYFAFDSSLDEIHNSYLYSYIYRNKAVMKDIYESYRQTIERFVSFRILKGSNNRYLSYLYRNMITESMVTPELAGGLFNVIFTNRILLKRKDIVSVSVRYENIVTPYNYEVRGQEIYIPIVGSNYQLLLKDREGNSYVCEEEYEIERLMVPDKIASYLLTVLTDEIRLDLWECERGNSFNQISMGNAPSMRRLSESEVIDKNVRKALRLKLVRFYFDNDMMEELDTLLESFEYSELSGASFAEILRTLVSRGMYEKAYDFIALSGGDGVDAKTIMRLTTRVLLDRGTGVEEDVTLCTLMNRAFLAGKYDEVLLQYLCRYLKGTSRELRELWKASKEKGLNTRELEERILTQFLFSNAYIASLSDIVESYDENNPESELTKAVLSQVCYDYFVLDEVLEDKYLDILGGFIENGDNIPIVIKLAYTRYYSERINDLSESVKRTLIAFLKDIIAKDMYFSYFKEYAKIFTFMHRFLDKTFVEYRTKEGKNISIHYMMEETLGAGNEYLKEDMKEMYHGIFVKMFVLFFGERMQYYIVEHGQEDELTESGTLTRNDMDEKESASKYGLINDIAISRTLGDYGTMGKLLDEYYRYGYLLRTLFKSKDTEQ